MDWIKKLFKRVWERVKAFFGFKQKKPKEEVQKENTKPEWVWSRDESDPNYNIKESAALSFDNSLQPQFEKLFARVEKMVSPKYVNPIADEVFKMRVKLFDDKQIYNEMKKTMNVLVRSAEKAAYDRGTINEVRPTIRQFSKLVLKDSRLHINAYGSQQAI